MPFSCVPSVPPAPPSGPTCPGSMTIVFPESGSDHVPHVCSLFSIGDKIKYNKRNKPSPQPTILVIRIIILAPHNLLSIILWDELMVYDLFLFICRLFT